MTEEEIGAAQRLITSGRRPGSVRSRWLWWRWCFPREARDYLRGARWSELEAMRGYVGVIDERGLNSSQRSLRAARNQRWAAELATIYGPGTWLELLDRSGNKHPDYPKMNVKKALDRMRIYGRL